MLEEPTLPVVSREPASLLKVFSGKAIGVTAARPEAIETMNVAEPLRAVARAIGAYATQIVAAADVEDDASIKAARAALRPLDDHRANAPRRAKGDAPVVTPAAPIPPVPARCLPRRRIPRGGRRGAVSRASASLEHGSGQRAVRRHQAHGQAPAA
jgi:hypothetical protein